MKKIIICLLSILFIGGCFGMSMPCYATDSSHLQNTYTKINSGKTVNIAYLGGSITNGYPNCIKENSWRQLTFDWIQNKYPKGKFNQIHAAMGGTGSDLNCYNIDQSLKLGTDEQPDLLFLEFAVNDYLENLNYDQAGLYYETIIRKCYNANPYMDIICIITTASDGNLRNKRYDAGRAHSDIATLYDLPCIWVSDYLWPELLAENYGRDDFNGNSALWLKYFDDGVHPGKGGHEKYFGYIRDYILVPEFNKVNNSELKKKVLPTPKYGNDYMDTRSISMVENPIIGTDFKKAGQYSVAQRSGATFKANFTGTAFGFMYVGDRTNGSVTYSVDGGKVSTVDLYLDASNTTEYKMLVENLDNKQHTIEVTLNETEHGNRLWIRYLYTNGDKNNVGVNYIVNGQIIDNSNNNNSSDNDNNSSSNSGNTSSGNSSVNSSNANSGQQTSIIDTTSDNSTDADDIQQSPTIKEETQYVTQKGAIPTAAIIVLVISSIIVLGIAAFWIVYFIKKHNLR